MMNEPEKPEKVKLTRRQARAMAKLLLAYADGAITQYRHDYGWRDWPIMTVKGAIKRYRLKPKGNTERRLRQMEKLR